MPNVACILSTTYWRLERRDVTRQPGIDTVQRGAGFGTREPQPTRPLQPGLPMLRGLCDQKSLIKPLGARLGLATSEHWVALSDGLSKVPHYQILPTHLRAIDLRPSLCIPRNLVIQAIHFSSHLRIITGARYLCRYLCRYRCRYWSWHIGTADPL